MSLIVLYWWELDIDSDFIIILCSHFIHVNDSIIITNGHTCTAQPEKDL